MFSGLVHQGNKSINILNEIELWFKTNTFRLNHFWALGKGKVLLSVYWYRTERYTEHKSAKTVADPETRLGSETIMKSMQLPLVTIFFLTYFYRVHKPHLLPPTWSCSRNSSHIPFVKIRVKSTLLQNQNLPKNLHVSFYFKPIAKYSLGVL